MALSLKNLVTDLQLAIADVLVGSSGGHVALCEWSCTCSYYRSLLAPYVLKTVALRNDEKCASTVLRIAQGPYSQHVKNLVYTGVAELRFHTIHNVFPPIVGKILSELQQFACLSSVSITFTLDWETGLRRVLEPAESGGLLTSMAEVVAAEKREVGLLLMYQTYNSLSQNIEHRITALELSGPESIEVSTFHSEAFHRFLHSIQKFTLGFSYNRGFYMNSHESHLQFVHKLGIFFFDRLHSVLEFSLKARRIGPIGLTGFRHAALALSVHQMPLLKGLYLEWIFIGPELVDFLLSKSTTLESVSLHECRASFGNDSLAENGIQWRVLFQAISNIKPSRLCQFTVTPARVEREAYEDEFTHELWKVMRNNPQRRMFHYSNLNEEHGYLYDDGEAIVSSFLQGGDQEAYDKLMEIVQANASRISWAETRFPSAMSALDFT